MATDRYTFEDNNALAGCYLHFQNIQAEDLHVFGVLIDVKKCKVNKDVHRLFKQRYRFISVFAQEELYTEINNLKLGDHGHTDLRLAGDALYQLALVSTYPAVNVSQLVADSNNPSDTTRFSIKKFAYTTNLGPAQIKQCIINIENTGFDQQNTNNIVILNNLMKRKDQRDTFNEMVGNTKDLTTMDWSHGMFKTLTQLRMFFSDSSQKSFPYLRAGQPNIKVYLNLRNSTDLVCYTRNLASYAWGTTVKPVQMGFLSTEIFLSEHERIIHTNTDATYLIEQNINYVQSGLANSFEPNFLHPVKFFYWGIQKKKYQEGNYFLAFDSFADPEKSEQDFMYDATTRFIMRFAGYKASVDYSAVTGYAGAALNVAIAAVDAAEINKASFLGSASDAVITYKVDAHDVIQSCFNGSILSSESNAATFSVDSIFRRIGSQPLIINDVQKYKKDVGLIIPNFLTLEEASIPIVTWETHFPSAGQSFIGLNCATTVGNVHFSQYSSGYIPVKHGASNEFSTSTTTSYTGKTLFSVILRDDKFNYGHEDFDICVKQWDNYGKYLNKTGHSILTTEFLLGQTPRFKKAGFYTANYHIHNYFVGQAPKGVHVYSFCQEPQQLQPTGSLNFSRATAKFKVTADADVLETDYFFISAMVYNVVEFKENTHQLLFQTAMQSV